MKRVLVVINGPNLNMLEKRNIDIYGKLNLKELEEYIKQEAQRLGIEVDTFQSNCEGNIVDKIQESDGIYSCIILNAGAYSHYSIAIRDAIECIATPVIEVHISNIYKREEFRHKSVLSSVCKGIIVGFGVNSYTLALNAALFL